ncbi:hypothetical protein [Kitasatospora sp. NPDC091207]|uniref:hypothetical protein n=1 Tax=Kitasatospora sp. NPDC091207 TaxID=3364083 RepID=UPI0038147B20
MEPDRSLHRRALTVAGSLTGAVCGALFFWSWGSPLAPLPVLPLWITGAAGLLTAAAASFGLPGGDRISLGTVAVFLLTLALWLGASAADLAATGIRDWVRTPRSVTAEVTGCRLEGSFDAPDTIGFDHHTCVYHWTFNGGERTERRSSDAYPDGHREPMWMSPRTGEIAGHPLLSLIGYAVAALVTGTVAGVGGWFRLRTEIRTLLGRPVDEQP